SAVLALFAYAGADPFLGTWKVDSSRSRFSDPDASFMFATIEVQPAGNGLKSTTSGADGQGYATDFTFDSPLDGTASKVVSPMPLRGLSAVDTISLTRVNDHTIMGTGKKGGRIVFSDTRVVSADGKTMTISRNGITPEGKKYSSTIVLSRFR